MALPLQPNVTARIFRNANPADPYPPGTPAATAPGYLEPAMVAGRLGTAEWLKWTHILYLEPTVDIRDAYNSQLDPARADTLADTVELLDSGGTNKTAYYVVFVEQVQRGTPFSHLRVYLDRFAPNAWPNDAI
ncbi:MAG: hypothetical protein ACK4RK_10755 [Gemmataceae bacterium]